MAGTASPSYSERSLSSGPFSSGPTESMIDSVKEGSLLEDLFELAVIHVSGSHGKPYGLGTT